MENITECLTIGLAVLGAVAQVLALVGKPKWTKEIRSIEAALDILGGNWGKSKNRD